MADGPSNQEAEQKPLPTERVAVGLLSGEHGLGVELKDKGASYDLGNTFRDSAGMLEGDRFSTIYFRTESGNIYRLGSRGTLVNASESRTRGGIVSDELDPKYLEKQRITVGEAMSFPNGRKTTRVSEIVAVTSRQYAPDFLRGVTQGKSNSIVDEFNSKMSGIPQPAKKPFIKLP